MIMALMPKLALPAGEDAEEAEKEAERGAVEEEEEEEERSKGWAILLGCMTGFELVPATFCLRSSAVALIFERPAVSSEGGVDMPMT
jgi:hypothetical protein